MKDSGGPRGEEEEFWGGVVVVEMSVQSMTLRLVREEQEGRREEGSSTGLSKGLGDGWWEEGRHWKSFQPSRSLAWGAEIRE